MKGKTMLFTTTYKLVNPPEPSMEWEEYRQIVTHEWKAFWDSRVSDERIFQEFFQTHPCMLPWIYGFLRIGGHGMFPNALITQPVLPSFTRKIPDFLWIARDSAAVYAVLIEIESPNKPWATSDGKPSRQLTQAIDQIKEWKAWFADPLNVAQFPKYYRIPDKLFSGGRSFLQKYILIYGRRSDPTLSEAFNKKRVYLQGEDELFMTYDRLKPNEELSQCLCVKINQGGYIAYSVPPTLRLNPFDAEDFSLIRDKEAAVRTNKYLSQIRKEFLIQRWPYWDSWALNGGDGLKRSSDYE
jgi:Shedu protein SduA, C-terminal